MNPEAKCELVCGATRYRLLPNVAGSILCYQVLQRSAVGRPAGGPSILGGTSKTEMHGFWVLQTIGADHVPI